ncbi:MAG: DUF1080 domain-containing protein [Planctomycetaceae bacterium]|jgi:hypothetical protein|nr:DUF1080 domain-containing protein [Planctomycetaceae bacterium]
MRKTILAVCLAGGLSVLCAAEDLPGYTDSPFLPNSKWRVHDPSRPQPKIISPGTGDIGVAPPQDAIALFDGTNFDAWQRSDRKPIDGKIENGAFNIRQTGQLQTKREFGDFQLHLEWSTPTERADRMNWGNSGVLIMGGFEIQIIESHDSFIYADGNAGAIYGQFPPLVNPARKAGDWQSFDVFFTAPKFEKNKLTVPAYATVVYNGVLVQNHQAILGITTHRALPSAYPVKETGPIVLQEHHSGVKFRNIWIRTLE